MFIVSGYFVGPCGDYGEKGFETLKGAEAFAAKHPSASCRIDFEPDEQEEQE